ncbi:heavy metal translocating P-type ATPase [Halogeometricum borinquense]|uniref:Heavy metal translocating P-type ATPase n=1 Tax=Halogeometricum borinquense TaxID=60847 RepID=A0A6C0UQF6_9EURY|nr:heavy metal translocating P-type ATPase [Halogeometricum borinquense]QIB76139.1 heavy metal translocating P-type ATPase [Halogeometricum borinquense]QIQ75420.1 heavy metal translocating P-type ATPase [Halogeometricum borinquense]
MNRDSHDTEEVGHDHGRDHPPSSDDDTEACGCDDGCDTDESSTSVASGLDGDGQTLRLSVPEMDCPSCAEKVTKSVRGDAGVSDVDAQPTTGTLYVQYDPAATDDSAVRSRVESAGYAIADEETVTFSVPEMDCPSCAGKVENSLDGASGIVDFETQPTAGKVTIRYNPDEASRGDFVAAIEGAGYAVEDDGGADSPHDVWRSQRALKTWGGAAFLAVGLGLEFVVEGLDLVLAAPAGYEISVAWVSYTLAVLLAGIPILRNGYYSAKNLSLDIDLLMTAGIVGAMAVNMPFEAATLAVLFSVAELLERFSMDRARNSLRELMELSPDTATVLRDSGSSETSQAEREEVVVPVEDVTVGETVIVRPGDRVPLDGTVTEGTSAVDESPITGESVPVDKEPGSEVFAGSIVEEGYLEIETTTPASESTLSKVVDMVEDANREKTEAERFIDRFARYYTPIIVVGAIATATVPPLLFEEPFRMWFVRALTLLVVACPCAFVISTPVSVVSGITSAARNGVLVKGGQHLEAMNDVDAVAVDKTGTLTTGELGVTDVVALNGNDESDVLGCAAAIESRSEHPIAQAIVEYAADRDVPERDIREFESITGKGVKAVLDDKVHYAGKPGLFESLGFDLEHTHVQADGDVRSDGGQAVEDARNCDHGRYLDLANEVVPRLQAEGKSVVLVGTEDEIEGVVAVADTVRPESAWAVSRLHDHGISKVVMLTGDNERTAQVIGERVGVDEVRADLLPEQKVEAVRELLAEHDSVAMVGDGVNDAPALAAATVGVAMGAAGTDTALETADVALLSDDLTRLPYLVDLSNGTSSVIRQNVWASLLVKGALAVAAPLGVISVATAIIVGDMGMSLGVTTNALRLAGVDPESAVAGAEADAGDAESSVDDSLADTSAA